MGLIKRLKDTAKGALNATRPGGDLGGVPARGIVVEVVSYPRQEEGEHALWSNVPMRLRRADDPNGPVAQFDCYLRSKAWRFVEDGHEVPIRVDATTGAVLGLDAEAHEAEVDAARAAEKARGPQIPDPLGGPIEADAVEPIEGVSLELWATTTARLAKDRVAPMEHDAYAAARGAPAGRWADINGQWHARSIADWRIGARFAAAYQAEMDRG